MSICDERSLSALAGDVLATPLPDLLRESVPACMVLILTSYSEQSGEREEGGGGGEEEGGVSEEAKKTATDSHNLLTKVLSEEVSTYISSSLLSFIIHFSSFLSPSSGHCSLHSGGH